MLKVAVFCVFLGVAAALTKDRPTHGPCPVHDALHPHESDCTKFYKCDHYDLILFNCPPGLHWNDREKICDWPANAGCIGGGSSVPPPGGCSESNPPPECPEHEWDKPAVHLPHQSDCTKFYQCDWGVRYLKVCPASLHFNPVLQVCDWPDAANCACRK